MTILTLIFKDGTWKRIECASIDQAQRLVDNTDGVTAFRCYQKSAKTRRRKME